MNKSSGPRGSDGAIHFRGYIAEFDALRALGTVFVLIGHFWIRKLSLVVFQAGECAWIAMDSFFVLSGLLITGILLDTRERPDYFRNYFIRRSLRIFPLYYLVLLIWVILTHLSWGGAGGEYARLRQHRGSPAWFAFYLGNFRTAYVGRWPSIGGLDPLWSLQIEEQFYLLFPLAVLWMRRDHLSRLLWLLVFLSPLFRVLTFLWNPKNPLTQYVLLPCHMEGLALGGLLAIRLRGGPWKIHKPSLAAVTAVLLLIACAGSIMTMPPNIDVVGPSLFNRLIGYSLSSFGCAGLILWLILFRSSRHTRIFGLPPLKYLGKISYGIYLLHPVAWRALRWSGRFGVRLRPDGILHFFAAVALSILLASLSWSLFEKPLLSLKDRLAPKLEAGGVPELARM